MITDNRYWLLIFDIIYINIILLFIFYPTKVIDKSN